MTAPDRDLDRVARRAADSRAAYFYELRAGRSPGAFAEHVEAVRRAMAALVEAADDIRDAAPAAGGGR